MIPVLVNFSEPIVRLHRHNKEAAASSSNYEDMAYFTAFTVSSYAASAIRIRKSVNPLLDVGRKFVAEQSPFHPQLRSQDLTQQPPRSENSEKLDGASRMDRVYLTCVLQSQAPGPRRLSSSQQIWDKSPIQCSVVGGIFPSPCRLPEFQASSPSLTQKTLDFSNILNSHNSVLQTLKPISDYLLSQAR